jgi:chromosome segregation ATPase
MTTPEPKPLTDEDLDAIQQRTDAHGRGIYGYVINDIEYQGNWVHDIRRLLAEVDRLRAELVSTTEHLTGAMAVVRAEETRLRAELETVSDEAAAQCREAAARTVRAETERDEARAENTALTAALGTVATALDSLGGRIYRDLRDEYDDITGRVGPREAKLLREFNAFADDQLAVLDAPAVRAALEGDQDGGDRDA